MSRSWIIVCASVLCVATIAGCCCRGGKRCGVFAPCACGYTYPHFAAPTYTEPAPIVPYSGGDPYYGEQPVIEGPLQPSYSPPAGTSTMPAPGPSYSSPRVGSGTR